MKDQRVSEAVIRRLPRYYRQLELLIKNGVERISSSELAEQMGLNPSQVRQDLNCFGGFGQQGYGYATKKLYQEISDILGLKREYSMVIAGAGNIGSALCNYEGFTQRGFVVKALFDNDQAKIGSEVNGIAIRDVSEMKQFVKDNNIDIGVICTRRSSAQQLADDMVEAGIGAIWNFVPIDINVCVPLENAQLIDSAFVLSFKLDRQD